MHLLHEKYISCIVNVPSMSENTNFLASAALYKYILKNVLPIEQFNMFDYCYLDISSIY